MSVFKNLVIANFRTEPDKKGNTTTIPWVDSADKIPGAKYNFKSKRYGLNPKLVVAILDTVGVSDSTLRSVCQQAIDQAEAANNPGKPAEDTGVYPVALDGQILGSMTLAEAKKVCGADHYIYINNTWKTAPSVLGLATLPPPPAPPAPRKVEAVLVDDIDDADAEDEEWEDDLDVADSAAAEALAKIKS